MPKRILVFRPSLQARIFLFIGSVILISMGFQKKLYGQENSSPGQLSITPRPSTDHESLDISPKLLFSVIPIYPRSHLLSGQTGGATLKYKVSPQGRVSQTRVLESTDPLFSQSAEHALRYWRFQPLTVNGEASPSVHKQTFTFQIISKSFYSIEVLPPGKPSTVPYPRNAIRPIYPEALRDQNLRGHCDFVMTVNSAGHVTDVQSENTSHPLFLESGLITAKKWKFIPQTITRDQLKIRVTFLFTPQSQSGQ